MITEAERKIAREIVAKFDTDKKYDFGYFYDPLREWISQALASHREEQIRKDAEICVNYLIHNKQYAGISKAILSQLKQEDEK